MKNLKTIIELPNGVRINFTNDSNKHVVGMFMSVINKFQKQYDKEELASKEIDRKQDYKDQMKKYKERCQKKALKSK